jgi:hypothetical protein
LRLRGYFRADPLEGAYFSVVLWIPSLNIAGSLELLVDTGATKTTLLDSDARRLGIQHERLTALKRPLLGLGGLVQTYATRNARLVFKSEDSSEHQEVLEELLVVRHSKLDSNIMRIPSVLGRDILNKYRIVYDKQNRFVLITDERK